MPSSTVPEDQDLVSSAMDCVYRVQGRTERQLVELLNQHRLVIEPGKCVGFGAQKGRNPFLAKDMSVGFQLR